MNFFKGIRSKGLLRRPNGSQVNFAIQNWNTTAWGPTNETLHVCAGMTVYQLTQDERMFPIEFNYHPEAKHLNVPKTLLSVVPKLLHNRSILLLSSIGKFKEFLSEPTHDKLLPSKQCLVRLVCMFLVICGSLASVQQFQLCRWQHRHFQGDVFESAQNFGSPAKPAWWKCYGLLISHDSGSGDEPRTPRKPCILNRTHKTITCEFSVKTGKSVRLVRSIFRR